MKGKKCDHKHMAVKLLVFGLIIIFARLYTAWDIWVVIGSLMVIKAIIIFMHSKKK